jgi:hypothetical protein
VADRPPGRCRGLPPARGTPIPAAATTWPTTSAMLAPRSSLLQFLEGCCGARAPPSSRATDSPRPERVAPSRRHDPAAQGDAGESTHQVDRPGSLPGRRDSAPQRRPLASGARGALGSYGLATGGGSENEDDKQHDDGDRDNRPGADIHDAGPATPRPATRRLALVVHELPLLPRAAYRDRCPARRQRQPAQKRQGERATRLNPPRRKFRLYQYDRVPDGGGEVRLRSGHARRAAVAPGPVCRFRLKNDPPVPVEI